MLYLVQSVVSIQSLQHCPEHPLGPSPPQTDTRTLRIWSKIGYKNFASCSKLIFLLPPHFWLVCGPREATKRKVRSSFVGQHVSCIICCVCDVYYPPNLHYARMCLLMLINHIINSTLIFIFDDMCSAITQFGNAPFHHFFLHINK